MTNSNSNHQDKRRRAKKRRSVSRVDFDPPPSQTPHMGATRRPLDADGPGPRVAVRPAADPPVGPDPGPKDPPSTPAPGMSATRRPRQKRRSVTRVDLDPPTAPSPQRRVKRRPSDFLPHLQLGDAGDGNDMMREDFDAVDSLRVHQFAFVLRSNGTYTYAIVSDRKEDRIRFVLDEIGSTKMIRRESFERCIRGVNRRSRRSAKNGSANATESTSFAKQLGELDRSRSSRSLKAGPEKSFADKLNKLERSRLCKSFRVSGSDSCAAKTRLTRSMNASDGQLRHILEGLMSND